MARALEFDYAAALEQATHLFWKKGYARTSLRDLLGAMRIGEGSFYNTFKSKKNTYLECLKHYNATIGRTRSEAFVNAPTALAAARVLFRIVLDCLDDPNTPSPICLMAGAMSSEVLNDSDLRTYVEAELTGLSAHLTSLMEADRTQGRLPRSFDSTVVTPIVLTYVQGMWRMALVSMDSRSNLERQTERFLSGLGFRTGKSRTGEDD